MLMCILPSATFKKHTRIEHTGRHQKMAVQLNQKKTHIGCLFEHNLELQENEAILYLGKMSLKPAGINLVSYDDDCTILTVRILLEFPKNRVFDFGKLENIS